MSKRSVLSLKRNSTSLEKTKLVVPESVKGSSKFDQDAFQKQAKKERIKRYHDAFDVVKSLDLSMPISKGAGKLLSLKLREQGISHKAARWAIKKWVSSDIYLTSVINGTCRFNLDGTEAELITDEERDYSRTILDKRIK
jgi:sRNA-binding protein